MYRLVLDKVVERQLTQVVIAVPEILQGCDLIAPRFLPVLLCQRQVVHGGLAADEALQHGGVGIFGYLQRVTGGLSLIDLRYRLYDIQFGITALFLALAGGRLYLALCGEPRIAFLTVIADGYGQVNHHLILHQWIAIGIFEALRHLVESY